MTITDLINAVDSKYIELHEKSDGQEIYVADHKHELETWFDVGYYKNSDHIALLRNNNGSHKTFGLYKTDGKKEVAGVILWMINQVQGL